MAALSRKRRDLLAEDLSREVSDLSNVLVPDHMTNTLPNEKLNSSDWFVLVLLEHRSSGHMEVSMVLEKALVR